MGVWFSKWWREWTKIPLDSLDKCEMTKQSLFHLLKIFFPPLLFSATLIPFFLLSPSLLLWFYHCKSSSYLSKLNRKPLFVVLLTRLLLRVRKNQVSSLFIVLKSKPRLFIPQNSCDSFCKVSTGNTTTQYSYEIGFNGGSFLTHEGCFHYAVVSFQGQWLFTKLAHWRIKAIGFGDVVIGK